ncbi:retrovirus-related Pol polyprotein from transposon TNT 1-94 [Lactuca sativa]|uniref:retrovirus-related Pol polyprotein from transposon TNT 1-94 n=1 Tax=Lactuca sativa TaxID=4236 RepID=UPI0022AE5AC6|nr:retrovirus-related Pol polyprotein from transposon TNT 1-94 [Lactuca sativa]
MTTKFAKLEKFEGVDFRRWKKKIHFMLTTLKAAYVLTTPRLAEPAEGVVEMAEETRKRQKWDNDDYICEGHILNGMSNALFDIHSEALFAKELWDTLELKYITEDASSKKFLVSDFNNYKMENSRSVTRQYNQLLGIYGQFKLHKMNMDESIVVSTINEKLPPSWKDFKHNLKHQKEEMSLVQLASHIRIEESLRAKESDKSEKPKGKVEPGQPSVHMVENKPRNQNHKGHGKRKHEHVPGNSNKKRKDLVCWRCNKVGHYKRDCHVNLGNNGAGNSGANGKDNRSSAQVKGGQWEHNGKLNFLRVIMRVDINEEIKVLDIFDDKELLKLAIGRQCMEQGKQYKTTSYDELNLCQ